MKEITKLFCRVGSKRPILKVLEKHFPSDYNLYMEPFVGSGDVFFRLKKEGVDAVINDIDKELMTNGYGILKKGYSLDGIDKYEKKRSIEEQLKFQTNLVNNKQTNGLDILGKEIYRICGTFGSTGKGKQHDSKISNISSKLKKMELYKDYMKNTKVFSTDYKNIIKKYDGKDSFMFLDPPYEKSKELYKQSFINYEEMRDLLKNVKGKFLLTINDSPEIRKVFSGFKMTAIDVKGQSHREKGIGSGVRKELIVKNY